MPDSIELVVTLSSRRPGSPWEAETEEHRSSGPTTEEVLKDLLSTITLRHEVLLKGANACVRQARAELGPEASLDLIEERAVELMGGFSPNNDALIERVPENLVGHPRWEFEAPFCFAKLTT